MAKGKFLESRKFKKIMGYVYGFGASIVLVGALFKLTHWPGANLMLTIGLLTEAIIFFISAFEPQHVEPDWSLVYPELEEAYHDVESKGNTGRKAERQVRNVAQQQGLDLSGLNLSEDTLQKLSNSINKLSENASQMADISNAVAATNEYANVMRKASDSVNALEVQLQSSMIVAETNKQLNKTMSEYIEKVNASATSTEALNHQISDLSKRMSALNNVYGNMLSAMNVKS